MTETKLPARILIGKQVTINWLFKMLAPLVALGKFNTFCDIKKDPFIVIPIMKEGKFCCNIHFVFPLTMTE